MLVVGPGGDGPGAVGTRLSEIVLAIDEPPPVVVRDWSTASFFTNPLEIGPEAVRRCLDGSPDAILAIDFLFWFAYGAYDAHGERIVDEAERDGLFEFGLSLLESIDVPILVGDLPDVRGESADALAMAGAKRRDAGQTERTASRVGRCEAPRADLPALGTHANRTGGPRSAEVA